MSTFERGILSRPAPSRDLWTNFAPRYVRYILLHSGLAEHIQLPENSATTFSAIGGTPRCASHATSGRRPADSRQIETSIRQFDQRPLAVKLIESAARACNLRPGGTIIECLPQHGRVPRLRPW